MDVTAIFTHILQQEKGDDILPFLKSLNKDQKKELVPGLKNLYKEYTEYVQQPSTTSYSVKATNKQRQMLAEAGFVCYNLKDFEASWSAGGLSASTVDSILPWYCPDWFENYFNNNQPHYFNYSWYMKLISDGYLQPNKEVIARALPLYIFADGTEQFKRVCKPENLLKYEVTLKEHIWYLFEFDTSIHSADRYMQFSDGSADGRWIRAIKTYADEGKIDRLRLLREAILASNKNFNQALSAWYVDLFAALEPTKAELVGLQNELMSMFNSAGSKPLNTALKYFKELVGESQFAVDAFLDNIPLVMSAETKNAVASGLMILDKLGKKYQEKREEICLAACQALMHQDEALQVRAAKLISNYGDPKSEALLETLQPYFGTLLFEAKTILSSFAGVFGADNGAYEQTMHAVAPQQEELQEIQMPETFDDFIYLASQAFDNNEVYHFDLLAAAVLRFQGEMTAENILKLAPAFQRAYKILTSDFTSSMGYLDNMLAKFMMDYGLLLVQFYPREAEPIRAMRASFLQKENERKEKWSGHRIAIAHGIKHWEVFTHSLGYKPHKHILLNAFFMLERKINLPLVSTPTHAPCWVSSVALVERIYAYQEAKVIPGDMDLQVAVARCLKNNRDEALQLADKKLKGEYRWLISFLFGGDYGPKDNLHSKPAWLVVAVTRDSGLLNKAWLSYTRLATPYLTGDFVWTSEIEPYTRKEWDYKLGKNIDVADSRKRIIINFDERLKKQSLLNTALTKLIPGKNAPNKTLYDFLELKYDYLSSEQNDIRRLLYLNPKQPGLLFAQIINKLFYWPDAWGENDKKLAIAALETLLTLHNKRGEMEHLMIASCMISSDKTTRAYAAELWIQGVNENIIDSERVGAIIGIHQRIELAPLKRFTDLVLANMYQISPAHNRALENLLAACISSMDAPVNNTKKLLEILAETMMANKSKYLKKEVAGKLDTWGNLETLSKIIQKIKTIK